MPLENKQNENEEFDNDNKDIVIYNPSVLREMKKTLNKNSDINQEIWKMIQHSDYTKYMLFQTYAQNELLSKINPIFIKTAIYAYCGKRESQAILLKEAMVNYSGDMWKSFKLFLKTNLFNNETVEFNKKFTTKFLTNYKNLCDAQLGGIDNANLKCCLFSIWQRKYIMALKIIQILMHCIDFDCADILLPTIKRIIKNKEKPKIDAMATEEIQQCIPLYLIGLELLIKNENIRKQFIEMVKPVLIKEFAKRIRIYFQLFGNDNNNNNNNNDNNHNNNNIS